MTQVRKRRPPPTPKHAAACCRPIDQVLDPALFKALADPTRVLLLACIAKCGRGCSVGEVAECCEVDVSVVSRHLSLLARSGVLAASKQGRSVLYSVPYESLGRRLRAIAEAVEECAVNGKEGCGSGCC